MPWGALRPAAEPYLSSHPLAPMVYVDDEQRIVKKARRKKIQLAVVDNSDLGTDDDLDDQ